MAIISPAFSVIANPFSIGWPRGFFIPTPVGHYSPDWAIVFHEGKVKHIYFIAETKGTMESLNLRPIEKSKIDCARKLFAKLSDGLVT